MKVCIEVNGTPGCQYPADHEWSFAIATGFASYATSVTVTHGAPQSDVSSYFP